MLSFNPDKKELLEMKADTSIPEKDGYTPMHGAGFQGRAEIAQMLINHGLDKSDRHSDGYTPMLRACWGREMRHTETGKSFETCDSQEIGTGQIF